MAKKIGGLGKGLGAIFIENDTEDRNATVTLKISEIEPNRSQPRKEFDEKALTELAESIKEHGLIQPILVRPLIGGGYQIVAGERRYRACRMAGLTEVPVIVTEYLDFSCVVCHVSEAVSMIKAWHLMNSCIHLWHRPFAFVCYPVINRTHIGRHNTDSCHDCISSEVRRILWKYNIKIIQSMIVFCVVNKSFHIVHTQF